MENEQHEDAQERVRDRYSDLYKVKSHRQTRWEQEVARRTNAVIKQLRREGKL